MAEQGINVEEHATQKMTRNQRYHLLNRESRLQRQRDQYNNDPNVIAKREERELKRAEKMAEKEAKKQAEKEAKRLQRQLDLQEKIKLATETKRVRNSKSQTTDSVRQASENTE
jgi:hypothetical protein